MLAVVAAIVAVVSVKVAGVIILSIVLFRICTEGGMLLVVVVTVAVE